MQPGQSPRSRLVRSAVAAAALLFATGCGANFEAQTNQIYQPAAGVNDQDGRVQAFNVLVVFDAGRGTVIGALLNQARRGDALVGVEGKSGNQSALTTDISGSPPRLPPDRLVQLTDNGVVSVSGGGLALGSSVEITLQFENAGPITVDVPVVPRTGDYANVPVGTDVPS